MYPEDRVLIAYLPDPADFKIIREDGWYRIPERHAPKGLFAEYYAFYFGSNFGAEKWAIHYYAQQSGYELLKRTDLFPDQSDHPRAADNYYKVTLGPLKKLPQPITSLRLRRITFLHTTWDRLQDAREINDLFLAGGEYCDRLFAVLKERGIQAERDFRIEDKGGHYEAPMVIECRKGQIEITQSRLPLSWDEVEEMADEIESEVAAKGGVESVQ
jgi:hypothetical protein